MILAPEPACWSWPLPPILSQAEEVDRMLQEQANRPLNHRMSREACELITSDRERRRFTVFHDGRCAICGHTGQHLVEDHCHDTGQQRGFLCRSCNVREGMSEEPVFVRYRRRHPAAILDLHEMYTGIGWHLGWSLIEFGAAAFERGVRPATPWPAYREEEIGG